MACARTPQLIIVSTGGGRGCSCDGSGDQVYLEGLRAVEISRAREISWSLHCWSSWPVLLPAIGDGGVEIVDGDDLVEETGQKTAS